MINPNAAVDAVADEVFGTEELNDVAVSSALRQSKSPLAADAYELGDEALSGASRPSKTPAASAERPAGDEEAAAPTRDASQPGERAASVDSTQAVLRSIAEAKAELESLDAREAALEEQLQLYSDVIGLRKELVVVQNDEARARRLRDAGAEALSRECPAVEASLEALEDEAQKSSLQHVWRNECEQNSSIIEDDTSRWIKIDTEDMTERLQNCKKRLDECNKEADRLYRIQEKKINLNTDDRDKKKKQLEGGLKNEMNSLAEKRSRLRQLDRDQAFHIKRGTHVKELHVSAQARRDVECGRIYNNESKAFSKKCSLEKEIADITEQVKQNKRILDDNSRNNKIVVDELTKQLNHTEENGKEVHELREVLTNESNDLKFLKQDLQRVLQYVRTRNYHSNYD